MSNTRSNSGVARQRDENQLEERLSLYLLNTRMKVEKLDENCNDVAIA